MTTWTWSAWIPIWVTGISLECIVCCTKWAKLHMKWQDLQHQTRIKCSYSGMYLCIEEERQFIQNTINTFNTGYSHPHIIQLHKLITVTICILVFSFCMYICIIIICKICIPVYVLINYIHLLTTNYHKDAKLLSAIYITEHAMVSIQCSNRQHK